MPDAMNERDPVYPMMRIASLYRPPSIPLAYRCAGWKSRSSFWLYFDMAKHSTK